MQKLNIGVIGTGYLGRLHALKFASHPNIETLYLVDINPNQVKKVAKEVAEKFSVKLHTETDYKKILGKVDAVSIVTPTVTHYEIAKFFLERDVPIFLEKPISHKLELVEELIEIEERKKIPFQVGFIERFQEPVKLLFQKVKNPVFIETQRISVFVERNLDIDVILDLMIHDIDLILLLKKGKEIKSVHAIGAEVFTDKIDIVSARVVFEDGCTCNLTASRISFEKQRRFRVFQKGRYFAIDTLNLSFLEVFVDTSEKDHLKKTARFDKGDPLKEELFSFLESLTNGKPVKVPASECLEAHRLAFHIKSSVDTNMKKIKNLLTL